MGKEIIILGIGRNTIVNIDLAESCGYRVSGLYHYTEGLSGQDYFGHRITGITSRLLSEDLTGKQFSLSMGDNDIRSELYHRIIERGGTVPSLIHPSAIVSKYAVIANGVHVYPLCVIDPNTEIGENTIISSKSTILHGSRIGSHCFIAPDAIVGANTIVENHVFIGLNATIISNKVPRIGHHSFIAASAVVTKSVAECQTMIGMPAKASSQSQETKRQHS